MPKFRFNPLHVVVWPDTKTIERAILEGAGNKEAKSYLDMNGGMIVECENKPCDMLAHGIVWEEVDDGE